MFMSRSHCIRASSLEQSGDTAQKGLRTVPMAVTSIPGLEAPSVEYPGPKGTSCTTLALKALVAPPWPRGTSASLLLHNSNRSPFHVDINECQSDQDVCSQICANTEGSFRCGCMDGFVLDRNGFTCNGNSLKGSAL